MNQPTKFPVKHSPISEFCSKRGIPDQIKRAFSAYVTSVYADRFLMKSDTDTIRILVGRLTENQVEQAWHEFIKELVRYLPKT